LLYVSETWTVTARDARRITAAQMKYVRRTAGYTWTDYKSNSQFAKKLEGTPGVEKLLEYKSNWIKHDRLSTIKNTLLPNWPNEQWQTPAETSRYVRPERVNKWSNSMTDI
jgi:hypothetical protein